jgi:hypothetical protein
VIAKAKIPSGRDEGSIFDFGGGWATIVVAEEKVFGDRPDRLNPSST